MASVSDVSNHLLDQHWSRIKNREHAGPVLVAVAVVLLTYTLYNVRTTTQFSLHVNLTRPSRSYLLPIFLTSRASPRSRAQSLYLVTY